MPSLRKRVSSYFRQLSFHNEPREKRFSVNENSFVTKYLQGLVRLQEGPPVISGKTPTDLPNYELGAYRAGSEGVVGCFTGPSGGLTTVKRAEKHLSIAEADIDFIDTQDENASNDDRSKENRRRATPGLPIDNSTMVIKVAGQEYFVTDGKKQKSQSLGSLSDLNEEGAEPPPAENNNDGDVRIMNESNLARKTSRGETPRNNPGGRSGTPKSKRAGGGGHARRHERREGSKERSFELSKSKSEGNPFQHKKRGRIIRVERPTSTVCTASDVTDVSSLAKTDLLLPVEWNRISEHVYGLSDSLYDRNLVTKLKNGDPIADCFGVITREDSAILAVADGVNWGEKASIAAKSAVHGCLHYLNKTVFNDAKPFETAGKCDTPLHDSHVTNTADVLVCLLRAFNCAHDLILENDGMLTTLTVAVVLPLREPPDAYVCCCCNVGDTLAYVYSQRFGVRELTKGSHDVSSNRDMRDALGALGPVDGTNPELSNLTLSVTKMQRGDIVFVASDGLTDNFDPNVCKFAVNSKAEPIKPKREGKVEVKVADKSKPPVKPPRKNCNNLNSLNLNNKNPSRPLTNNHKSVNFNRTLSMNDDSNIPDHKKNNYNFLRSKTSVDLRYTPRPAVAIQRNSEGMPYITPVQRYDLTLLLMEDILKNGISGRENRCVTAKRLCENLMSFTMSITAAKRRTLEDNEMYFDSRNGVLVEVTNVEKKVRRKRALERVQNLPGKLDHVTVVAINVGDFSIFR